MSRNLLNQLVDDNILTGGRRTTAANHRKVLKEFIDDAVNKTDDPNKKGGYMKIDNNGRVDISFINAASPQGYFLRDDGTWAAAGGGGGASSLGELDDVLLEYPVDGQILLYDEYEDVWYNGFLPGFNQNWNETLTFGNTSDGLDAVLNATDVTSDGAVNDSPKLVLTGTYDADPGAPIDSQEYDFEMYHNMLSAGAAPESRVDFSIDGMTLMSLTNDGDLGIGTDDPEARLHIIVDGDEQIRLGYDASNYWSSKTSLTGETVFDAAGVNAGFEFIKHVWYHGAGADNTSTA
jgi:hypothetical protein